MNSTTYYLLNNFINRWRFDSYTGHFGRYTKQAFGCFVYLPTGVRCTGTDCNNILMLIRINLVLVGLLIQFHFGNYTYLTKMSTFERNRTLPTSNFRKIGFLSKFYSSYRGNNTGQKTETFSNLDHPEKMVFRFKFCFFC